MLRPPAPPPKGTTSDARILPPWSRAVNGCEDAALFPESFSLHRFAGNFSEWRSCGNPPKVISNLILHRIAKLASRPVKFRAARHSPTADSLFTIRSGENSASAIESASVVHLFKPY